LLIASILIFRPGFQSPERNEQQKLGIYLGAATFIVYIGKMFLNMFLIYDLISAIMYGIITYIFYKIFTNSISVIKQYGIKQAFSIEEIMGASLMISIAFVSLSALKIFDLSITNILSVMLVLFLGWKNGMLVGATAGITIGMVLGIITSSSPILVASYAISGMIAGLLNKLGKVGVIIGFCAGNAILTYVANGNTVPIITIREILIASLGLLVIPKSISLDITDIMQTTKCLPTASGRLEGEVETINKLNSVSETISDMAQSYDEAAETTLEKENSFYEESKKYFINDLLNNLDDNTENLLYDEILENEDAILDDVYKILQEKDAINRDDFISILEKRNNYIMGFSEEEPNEELNESIKDIVKTINATYRINKLNMIWKQKEASNKKVLAAQLGGVSKVISSLAENIEEQDKKRETKTELKYKLQIGQATATKNKSEVSGDSNLNIRLKDGKYLVAISDGMGSGPIAKKSSSTVIKMLKNMLSSGFDKDVSIGLINSAINLNSNEETYASIDLSIFNLSTGNIEFVKNGACPTFIKSGNKVETVKAISFPAGMLDKIDLVVYDKDLKEEDIIVMCSDGILESNTEYENKELWLKQLLENMETTDVQKIADIILTESIDNGYGIAKDDMTVIVVKIEKNK